MMDSIDWLKKLISFDTTSKKSNLALIEYVSAWFDRFDIPCHLTYDDKKQKANLLATILPEHSTHREGLILSGHTDVVPVDGQVWATHPFEAVIKDNYLYGRGACDMKGFIAVVLSLVPTFQTLGLSKPLHIALSYDEEIGCLGVPRMISAIKTLGFQPLACIVGEPSHMKPIVAHKGINVFRCTIKGLSTHSSLTSQGCNAIEYAAELITWLKQYAKQIKTEVNDDCYDIAYSTMTTNMISGGIAVNTIPDQCELYFEFRNLPHMSPDSMLASINQFIQSDLLPKMKKVYRDANIQIDTICAVPAHEIPEEADLTRIIRGLTHESTIRKVSYATEAGLFQQAGIPTLICGPGNIEQAHGANEYIDLKQLALCEEFLMNVVKELLC